MPLKGEEECIAVAEAISMRICVSCIVQKLCDLKIYVNVAVNVIL